MRSNHDADLREAAGRAGRVVGTRSWPAALGGRTRLVLASALMLFVELALIRWTSSNNLYLVPPPTSCCSPASSASGWGSSARWPRDLFPLAPPLLATLVGFVLAFPVRTGTTGTGGWELAGALGMPPLPRPLSLTVIFLLTVAVLMALGQEVARTFACFAPLEAYRLDVLGSLTGIVAFAALSFLRLPPLGWALGAAALSWCCSARGVGWPAAGIAAFVLVLGVESVVGPFQWSPYYKIRTQDLSSGSVRVEVNNTPLQTTFSVDQIRRDSPFYLYPYTYAGARDDVLVIGAGTGNDVAVALEEGAKSVDAVEIDPALLQIGRDRHPDRPYSDPRVTAYVDDGRAFMERADREYDLILLALPDSATIVTGQSALRLENYLFTTQALERARSLLKPGGTFAMYNYYEPWLLDRYANTVSTVYDTAPCAAWARPTGSADRRSSPCVRTGAPEGAPRPGRPTALPSNPPSTTGRSPTSGRAPSPPSTCGCSPSSCWRRSSWCGPSPDHCGRCARMSTSSSWARPSSCWRPRTWSSSRCSSGPPGP